MKTTIYLYANNYYQRLIREIFFEYDVLDLKIENLNDPNFRNKKVLFITSEKEIKIFDKNFFYYNSVVVFSQKKTSLPNVSFFKNTRFFLGPQNLKKFLDEVKNFFLSSPITFMDIKISNEVMTNTIFDETCQLTYLEKKILIELIDKKQLNRKYFLESILGLNKDTQTKTIESHLTRIRKKLLLIKSNIQITSKEDNFYIET